MNMTVIACACLALLVATSVTLLELLTSKYPRTFTLIKRSKLLYAYSAIYGVISFFGFLMLDYLGITLEGLGMSRGWVRALGIGLTVKALLHVRLFSVTVGSQTVPVGIETLVQLFEPWMLREVDIEHYNAVQNLVGERAKKHTDLQLVKATAKRSLPAAFPKAETAAFQADVDAGESVERVLELYLGFMGLRTLDRVFPP